MNTAEFYHDIVLHDDRGGSATAYLRHDHVDIEWSMFFGTEPGEDGPADEHHWVRLSPSDMDKLARAWLRYRVGYSDGE